MAKIFLSIYRLLKKKRTLFFVFFILFTALLAFLASSIKLKEDVSDFMPAGGEAERVNFVNNNISLSEKIIISLSNSDTSLFASDGNLYNWADALADSIAVKDSSDIKGIFYKISDDQTFNVGTFILRNLPYYLDESDYAHIDSVIAPENIRKTLTNDRKILVSPAGYALKKILVYDPLHFSGKALNKFTSFQVDKVYNIENGYILSKDRKSLFIFVSSKHPVSETAKNKPLVEALYKSFDDIKSLSHNTVNITSFGAVDVGVTNATQIRKDSYLSIIISVCLILILLGLYFRKPAPLYLIIFPVIFGGVFAVALLFVFKGTISSIAIGAGSAIFGIAINYSLHFLVHIKNHGNIDSTLDDLASPMVTGSITTIGAFLSLMVLSSKALSDFGLFAALTLVGSLLFVLVVLPLIPGLEKLSIKKSEEKESPLWDKLSDFKPENQKYLVLATLILTIILYFFSRNVKFDADLNQINYMTDGQRKAFKELSSFTTLSRHTTYLITEGTDLNKALKNYERNEKILKSLEASGKIKGFMGVGAGLLSDSLQNIKAERWNRFWATRKNTTEDAMIKYGREAGFSDESFRPFLSILDSTFTAQPFEHFSPLSGSVFNDMLISKEGRSMIVTLVYSDKSASFDPTVITSKYKDTFIYDQKSIADSLVSSLVKDFNKVLWICGLIVIVFLTISFGRLELSLISFIPMAVSWFWILGIMSIFDIRFNVVNVILATFIFGLGDDYSIFITEGLMKDYSHKTKMLKSYKTAVLLSALTMFIGIGTLIIARHPAMKSLAVVTIIGMTSVVIISFIAAPFLFNALTKTKGRNRMMPVTISNFVYTVYSFIVFLAGSLFLTLTGYILLKVKKPDRENKLKFHKHLCRISKFVVYRIPRVKTRVINETGEDFNKPSVIICNHQAHIDLAFMMMLSPKIIILTNDWVWNSPFYGKIVRFADFYPVADGIESSIEKLSELVKNGYSILVFPEGTRSEDCSIRRFHKGAFYLAEKLNLDIVPVLIHGLGHCLPKKEFLLRKGECTVKISRRISPSDKSFGEDYSARAKNFRKFYAGEYQKLAHQIETPGYFNDRIIHNYIYKGREIEWRVRKTLKYGGADEIINLLPEEGRALFLNSGDGCITLLASLVRKNIVIDAVEHDDENRILAENCVSKPENLIYHSVLSNIGNSQHYDTAVWICHDKDSLQKAINEYEHCAGLNFDNLIITSLSCSISGKHDFINKLKTEVVKFAASSGFNIRENETGFILNRK